MNTIINIIENRIESDSAKTSFTFLGDGEKVEKSITLFELRKKALGLSIFLQKNKTVLILLPQGVEFIEAFLGCLYSQAVAVPFSPPAKHNGFEKLQYITKDADISCVITNEKIFTNSKKWFGEDCFQAVKVLIIEDIISEQVESLAEFARPEEIAYLQYTSGSTSSPKAVMISHKNIIANSKIVQQCFQNNEKSVSVCWLPTFHDMGLIDGVIQPIFSNFSSFSMSPLHFLQRPVRWFKAISKYKATYSGGPNFAFDFCTERIGDEELEDVKLDSLRCLYNGSEPIRTETIKRFVDRFTKVGFSKEKIFTCYGLAEATLAVTTSKIGVSPRILEIEKEEVEQNKIKLVSNGKTLNLVSCGKVFCDTSVKIVNTDSYKECLENEIGEIYVSGESISPGYRNNAVSTKEAFIDIENEIFLRTGDLGFLNNDELFITGRIKDLIIIRGKNHYPQDIEKTVSDCHEALKKNACAAFSVEIESEEKLIVVQEVKRTFLQKVDFEVVPDLILRSVSQNHGLRPFDVVLIKPLSLPKTTSGKIKRFECRKLWKRNELKALTNLKKKYEKK